MAFGAKTTGFLAAATAVAALTLVGGALLRGAPQSARPDAVLPEIERRLARAGFSASLRTGDVIFPHVVAERDGCAVIAARLPVEADRDAAFANAARLSRGAVRLFYGGRETPEGALAQPRFDYWLNRALGPLGLDRPRPPRIGLIESGPCAGAVPDIADLSRRP